MGHSKYNRCQSSKMADKSTHVKDIYLPGETVSLTKEDESSIDKIYLGPGLRKYGKEILVSKPGVMQKKKNPTTYWIDCHQKRYVPIRGDNVIGIVVNKLGDYFKVQIGSSEEASLSSLAFQGATKKNKPNVQIGDLIFAKLLIASIDMEPELVCVNSFGESAGLGILPANGFMFTVPLHHIRKILNPKCSLMKNLGRGISFEVAVGMNGRIWIKAKTLKQTMTVAKVISLAEHMDNEEINKLCKKSLDKLAGF